MRQNKGDVLLIQGASTASSKQTVANCNEEWSRYKAVICTPAVAAGVDFSLMDYFHTTFVYGTNKSNTARELNQQSGRVRHTVSGKVYVCLETTPPKVERPCSFDAVCDWFDKEGSRRRQDLVQIAVDDTAPQQEYVAVNVSSCPESLKRILCYAITEKNCSRANMQEQYESIVREGGGVVVKLPRVPPSYRSVLNRRECVLQAEAAAATLVSDAPLMPNAHISEEGKLLSDEVQRKAEVSQMYGGVDITNAVIMQFMCTPICTAAVKRWATVHTPFHVLFDREATQGCMQPFQFECHGGRTHLARHSAVLELTSPEWQQQQSILRMLYAVGCTGVERVTEAVYKLSDTIGHVMMNGMCTRVASDRMQANPQLFNWACVFLKDHIRKSKGGDTKVLHLCKAACKMLSIDYALEWVSARPSTRSARVARTYTFTPVKESLDMIVLCSLLYSRGMCSKDIGWVPCSAALLDSALFILPELAPESGAVINTLQGTTYTSYVQRRMRAEARLAAVREYASAVAGHKLETTETDGGSTARYNPLNEWADWTEPVCDTIKGRVLSAISCLHRT